MESAYADALKDAQRVFDIIQSKPALNEYYKSSYVRYKHWLKESPSEGMAIELGSGLGPIKSVLPEIMTTDVIPYPGLDRIVDATRMPFENDGLKFIGMLNVFHHIPRVQDFLSEAERCLRPGGKVLIIDQHSGFLGRFVFKYLHNEPYDVKAQDWDFKSNDPLKDANGALAWIVFQRDKKKFETLYPRLRIVEYRRHTPLYYWFSGGLKSWTLIPTAGLIKLMKFTDSLLVRTIPESSCFVDVVLEKV
jgi:SAM-dependent methyltransferase